MNMVYSEVDFAWFCRIFAFQHIKQFSCELLENRFIDIFWCLPYTTHTIRSLKSHSKELLSILNIDNYKFDDHLCERTMNFRNLFAEMKQAIKDKFDFCMCKIYSTNSKR